MKVFPNITVWLFLLASALNVSITSAQGDDATIKLKIGVREDAVSMSYLASGPPKFHSNILPGPLRKAGYSGYMVYICDRVLIEMERQFGKNLSVVAVPVEARERFSGLNDGSFHILCDPTKATKQRLEGLISSAPLFVTGTSFAERPLKNPCGHIVGLIKTDAVQEYRGLYALIKKGVLYPYEEIIEAWLSKDKTSYKKEHSKCEDPDGTSSEPSDPADRADPVVFYDTHTEAAAAFCDGEIAYYLGDKEIVSQTLGTIANCAPTVSNKTYTEDRYLILGKISRDMSEQQVEILLGRFFGILSQMIYFKPSLLDDAFQFTFSPAKKSEKLRQLYWGLRGNEP